MDAKTVTILLAWAFNEVLQLFGHPGLHAENPLDLDARRTDCLGREWYHCKGCGAWGYASANAAKTASEHGNKVLYCYRCHLQRVAHFKNTRTTPQAAPPAAPPRRHEPTAFAPMAPPADLLRPVRSAVSEPSPTSLTGPGGGDGVESTPDVVQRLDVKGKPRSSTRRASRSPSSEGTTVHGSEIEAVGGRDANPTPARTTISPATGGKGNKIPSPRRAVRPPANPTPDACAARPEPAASPPPNGGGGLRETTRETLEAGTERPPPPATRETELPPALTGLGYSPSLTTAAKGDAGRDSARSAIDERFTMVITEGPEVFYVGRGAGNKFAPSESFQREKLLRAIADPLEFSRFVSNVGLYI